jgi:hypothetical protein
MPLRIIVQNGEGKPYITKEKQKANFLDGKKIHAMYFPISSICKKIGHYETT